MRHGSTFDPSTARKHGSAASPTDFNFLSNISQTNNIWQETYQGIKPSTTWMGSMCLGLCNAWSAEGGTSRLCQTCWRLHIEIWHLDVTQGDSRGIAEKTMCVMVAMVAMTSGALTCVYMCISWDHQRERLHFRGLSGEDIETGGEAVVMMILIGSVSASKQLFKNSIATTQTSS